MMLLTIFCTRFPPYGYAGFESSILIGYCVTVPYLFGAEGYGACCGLFDISCLYFFICLVTQPDIEITT